MALLRTFRSGQRAILKSFAKHGLDSVYVPSDMMDLRVCCAMAERGVLVPFNEEDLRGYELSAAGVQIVAALNPSPQTAEEKPS